MPKKSVREMSVWERMHYSLASRTFHAVMRMSLILGVVAIAIGFTMYLLAMNGQYINTAYHMSSAASSIISASVDPVPITDMVARTYRSLSEEERQDQISATYRNHFRAVENDKDYQQIMGILRFLLENSEVDSLYICVYDEETMRMVYVADPDDSETHCPPGYWEDISEKDLKKFLEPNGKGPPHVFTYADRYGWLCTSGAPIVDEDGQTVGFVQADVSVVGLVLSLRKFLLQYALVLLAVTLVLAYIFVRHFKRTLIQPINQIAEAAENYVKDRRDGSDNTDHFSREVLNITTGDEIENLSLTMADMEKDLNEYEVNLTKITAEKERIGTELSLATRIQADMLPNIYPAFPERPEFDVYASMTPAKEVGGDFYDFFLIDDDHLGLVIADVSGKGIPAALFMMVSKILVQNCAMAGGSPGKVLEKVNAQICQNNREEMFVTVWFAILDLNTGKLTAANAGHEFPALRHAPGSFELYKDKHGFVIGGMDGMRYKDYEIQLSPGDQLFVYTDGVAEATDAENEMFGTDRMLDALNSDLGASPDQILSNMHQAVGAFVREAPQFDDLTMLCLEYRGPKQEKPSNED